MAQSASTGEYRSLQSLCEEARCGNVVGTCVLQSLPSQELVPTLSLRRLCLDVCGNARSVIAPSYPLTSERRKPVDSLEFLTCPQLGPLLGPTQKPLSLTRHKRIACVC